MDLLEKINRCESKKEIDEIVSEELRKVNFNAKKMKQFGMVEDASDKCLYRGFIPSSSTNDSQDKYVLFGIDITDVFYEFAYYVNQMDLRNNTALLYGLEYFLTNYLFKHSKINYDNAFNHHLCRIMGYKEKSESNINIKKTVLAEQILSLFGFDSYLCLGTMEKDNIPEMHGFNIIKRQIGYLLVDYDLPVHSYRYSDIHIADYPFVGKLNDIEFKDFVQDGELKEFQDYNYVNENKKPLMRKRGYIVKKYQTKKDSHTKNI